MTEKLYLQSIEAGYYQHFNASVTAVESDSVVLDRTLFYPLGGGQNWDTGQIEGPNGRIAVTEVRGRDQVSPAIANHFALTSMNEKIR